MALKTRVPVQASATKVTRLPQLKQTLRDTFGLTRLRPAQEEVIRLVMKGQNTLAIMPTGAGKSLCYQLPALHLPGTTIVVSPLIALMKDQADKLEALGLATSEVNSTLSTKEEREEISHIRKSQAEFVFATPERLENPEFLGMLKKIKIDVFVIDEAHCMSQWGHDFRPSYLGLGKAIRALGNPPVLALTATATPDVVADIQKQLGLKQLEVVHAGIYRPNLNYEVCHTEDEEQKREQLLSLVRENQGTGMVYMATVKAVEETWEFLRQNGIDACKYHGRMRTREREESQDRFMSGQSPIMVATNAFGMGIDKADIRYIIHYHFPGSLDAYYQESGRAGRDGEPARCILFYQKRDKSVQSFLMAGRYPKPEEIILTYCALRALVTESKGPVTFDEIQTKVARVAKNKIRVILAALKSMDLITESRPGASAIRYGLSRQEPTDEQLAQLASDYVTKQKYDQEKLKRMIMYAQSALCRWRIILNYFAEKEDFEHCEHCDNCRSPVEGRLQDDAEIVVPGAVSA